MWLTKLTSNELLVICFLFLVFTFPANSAEIKGPAIYSLSNGVPDNFKKEAEQLTNQEHNFKYGWIILVKHQAGYKAYIQSTQQIEISDNHLIIIFPNNTSYTIHFHYIDINQNALFFSIEDCVDRTQSVVAIPYTVEASSFESEPPVIQSVHSNPSTSSSEFNEQPCYSQEKDRDTCTAMIPTPGSSTPKGSKPASIKETRKTAGKTSVPSSHHQKTVPETTPGKRVATQPPFDPDLFRYDVMPILVHMIVPNTLLFALNFIARYFTSSPAEKQTIKQQNIKQKLERTAKEKHRMFVIQSCLIYSMEEYRQLCEDVGIGISGKKFDLLLSLLNHFYLINSSSIMVLSYNIWLANNGKQIFSCDNPYDRKHLKNLQFSGKDALVFSARKWVDLLKIPEKNTILIKMIEIWSDRSTSIDPESPDLFFWYVRLSANLIQQLIVQNNLCPVKKYPGGTELPRQFIHLLADNLPKKETKAAWEKHFNLELYQRTLDSMNQSEGYRVFPEFWFGGSHIAMTFNWKNSVLIAADESASRSRKAPIKKGCGMSVTIATVDDFHFTTCGKQLKRCWDNRVVSKKKSQSILELTHNAEFYLRRENNWQQNELIVFEKGKRILPSWQSHSDNEQLYLPSAITELNDSCYEGGWFW